MLSPLVIVGLVLSLLARRGDDPAVERLRWVSLPAALIACLAFSFEPGTVAALLTVPWLVITLTFAVLGALRLLGRTTLSPGPLGFDIALILVSVGGSWLTISRAGLNPMGFNDAIVELTAVHFHYAGFALPVVAGLVAEHRGRTWALPALVTVGVVATAIGIMAGGVIEWLGATGMAVAGLLVAANLIAVARAHRGQTRAALLFAGCALVAGMAMAIVWSWTVWFGVRGPGLDLMVATHGSLNALGFGLVGLIGLHGVAAQKDGLRLVTLGRTAPESAARALKVGATGARPEARNALGRPLRTGWHRHHASRPVEGPRAEAIARLHRWAGHTSSGASVTPPSAPLTLGQHVAVALPTGPLTITAICEVTAVFDEPDRYGFAYATTSNHPMLGEESFVITGIEGDLNIEIAVVSHPASWMTRSAPWILRRQQAQMIERYLDGLAAA